MNNMDNPEKKSEPKKISTKTYIIVIIVLLLLFIISNIINQNKIKNIEKSISQRKSQENSEENISQEEIVDSSNENEVHGDFRDRSEEIAKNFESTIKIYQPPTKAYMNKFEEYSGYLNYTEGIYEVKEDTYLRPGKYIIKLDDGQGVFEGKLAYYKDNHNLDKFTWLFDINNDMLNMPLELVEFSDGDKIEISGNVSLYLIYVRRIGSGKYD